MIGLSAVFFRWLLTAYRDSSRAFSRFHTKCGALRKKIHKPTVNRKAKSPSASARSPDSSPVICGDDDQTPGIFHVLHKKNGVSTSERSVSFRKRGPAAFRAYYDSVTDAPHQSSAREVPARALGEVRVASAAREAPRREGSRAPSSVCWERPRGGRRGEARSRE